MHRPWLATYPPGVPADLPPSPYATVVDLMNEAFFRFQAREAYRFLGSPLTFGAVAGRAEAFAAYLQSLGLVKGDRIALMMPNMPQYPIAVVAALKAGLVVVNVNPLYTSRELSFQLADCGAKAIVIFEAMAATLAGCFSQTGIRHVVIARIGDELPMWKGRVADLMLRHVKKAVPPYKLPMAVPWSRAISHGKNATFQTPSLQADDLAILQYTGGTTGVAKGAMLTHRNILSNVLQAHYWYAPALDSVPEGEQATFICALPLYHIFGFTVNMLLALHSGGRNILIVNPRDIGTLVRTLRQTRFHSLPAVNTLFDAIARHEKARLVDWSSLLLSVGGGMAVQHATAERWHALTGRTICEGYGLSEASPVLSCNPVLAEEYTGSIGLPLPSTELAVLDDAGAPVPLGSQGEIAARGPQIMAGYWQRPEETTASFTSDGWFRTGDIGVQKPNGSFSIVDRKKDLIIVSGFNVYPNEVESVLMELPGVLEAAAVAVRDDLSGEAVKAYVVRENDSVTEDALRAHCRQYLTRYKQPKFVEFRSELPKTSVGKVLRRALRES
ncbi:AMP-binding protein [Aureimonas psammosilenae]|uniref:AMP-binding protein n=1 Tax=Aureimonas psammosilenae TaxID=2495496 RepID=UPI001AEECFE8|nr:AMP-binding protein [Aureimonas psammosilenae]